jgi:methyl-accepting chemotaxis protein
MTWVENLKLRSKLALILLLPVLCLFILSAYMLNIEWQTQNRLSHLTQAGKLADIVTGLIHELQLERGRSGSFLENKGRLFYPELIRQHQASDIAWNAFNVAMVQQQNNDKLAALTIISHKLNDLKKLREQVEQLKINASQAVQRYNSLIDKLFNELESLISYVENSSISRFLNGYLSLSQAKELAGQERVRGSRILSSPDSFQTYDEPVNSLIAKQNLLLQITSKQTPASIQPLLANINNLKCVTLLHTKRLELNQEQKQFSKENVSQWFNLTTCRIEQLRKIELRFMQQIKTEIDKLINKANQHFFLILILTLIPIIPSIIFIFLVDKNVNSVLRWLLNAMQGIAAGNLTLSLPPESKDELGRLSHGLNQLRLQLSKQETILKQRLLAEQKHNQELSQRTEELQQFAVKIASGDLRSHLDEDNSTMTQLSHSLNQMVDGLTNLTVKIRDSSSTINSMVLELHSSIDDQSSGASEQAASVNQTVTTLEELRATSGQTLLKANTLGDIAEKARNEGKNGREAIEQSISDIKIAQAKMDAIAHTILTLNDWIQRVGDITTSVHDIARQLRLISLNASIEANNAGETGKGFAVVASEVKGLAERSQKSTIHVQNILEEIRRATDRAVMATEDGSKSVEQGLKQIQRTGEVVLNLESAVEDTSLASRQIVVAVTQEVVAIDQISTAIKDIHTITEQFAGTAQQSRYAAKKLTELVKHLDNTVNQYQL